MDWNQLTGAKTTAGAISRWLNTAQLSSGTNGDADTILQEAQQEIYTRLRHWRMLPPPVSGTLTIGSDALTPPSDFLEPYLLFLTGNYFGELKQKTPNEVIGMWQYDGTGARVQQRPTVYYFNQSAIQFESVADLAYTYSLLYYQVPAMLSATNLTNFLTQYYPRLIRTATMMAGAEWTKESNQGTYDRTYWEQQFEAELLNVQAASDRAHRALEVGALFIGGGPGAPPAYNSW